MNKLVHEHYEELKARYPELILTGNDSDGWVLRGWLEFSASYMGIILNDKYDVEIALPINYPKEEPTAKEIGGRIPMEFHPGPAGTLCLEVPIEIHRKFSNRPTLLGFVEDLLIHFLYTFSYKEKYGLLPFGERSHGGKGIIEYYSEQLKISDSQLVLEFLKICANNNYRGHQICPCKSGMKLRNCHGAKVRQLMQYQKSEHFLYEYKQAINYIMKSEDKKFSDTQLSKVLKKELKKSS